MKTLNEIANSRNYYTADTIPERYRGTKENYESKLKCYGGNKIPEDLKALTCLEIDTYYECKQDRDCFYFEHSQRLIKFKDSNFILMLYTERTGKHYIHPHYSELKKFYYSTTKNIVSPNYIGVFTEKKALAYLDYCIKYIEALEALKTEIELNIENATKKINSYLDLFTNKGVKIQSYQNKHYIDCKNFYITLELDRTTGYLNERVEYRGKVEDVINLLNK